MSTLATAGLTVGGIALIGVTVRDIFETLLHPEGRGAIARGVMGAIWRVCHLAGRRVLHLAGPLGLLMVVGAWATLLVLGWALLLWPQLEGGFRVEGPGGTGPVDAIHLSLTTLTTVGSPEYVPTEGWLRVIAPLEALVGFGLLSASISYLLLIYPALARRRSLAYELYLLEEAADGKDALPELDDAAAAGRLYADLTSRLVAVERDLVALPVTYYFAERDQRFSLAAAIPHLVEIARRGSRTEGEEAVRLRARILGEAAADLAQTTAALFPRTRAGSSDEVFAAYARDHMLDGVRESARP